MHRLWCLCRCLSGRCSDRRLITLHKSDFETADRKISCFFVFVIPNDCTAIIWNNKKIQSAFCHIPACQIGFHHSSSFLNTNILFAFFCLHIVSQCMQTVTYMYIFNSYAWGNFQIYSCEIPDCLDSCRRNGVCN